MIQNLRIAIVNMLDACLKALQEVAVLSYEIII